MMKELGRAVVSADGGCASQRPRCNQPRTKILNATAWGRLKTPGRGESAKVLAFQGEKEESFLLKLKYRKEKQSVRN